MTLARLNLLTAIAAMLCAVAWIALGDALSGLIWLILAIGWVIWAIFALRSPEVETSPLSRLGRRLFRMLRWF
jgi:hypothetical protein